MDAPGKEIKDPQATSVEVANAETAGHEEAPPQPEPEAAGDGNVGDGDGGHGGGGGHGGDGDGGDGAQPEGGQEPSGEGAATDVSEVRFARLKSIVESLLFAAEKPLPLKRLMELTRERERRNLESVLQALCGEYTERGIHLSEVAGGWQFRTAAENAQWVQQLIGGKPVRLSRAQLETMAIIAYRQPITRPEIDEVRGVDSGGTLKVLLDRDLIRVLGKKEEPGRPLLYGTTKEFLTFFNLNDLRELPTLREYHELTEDSMRVAEKLGVDLAEAADKEPAPSEAASGAEETSATEEASGAEETSATEEASASEETSATEEESTTESNAATDDVSQAASEEALPDATVEQTDSEEPASGPAGDIEATADDPADADREVEP